jgi:hypothetical protein
MSKQKKKKKKKEEKCHFFVFSIKKSKVVISPTCHVFFFFFFLQYFIHTQFYCYIGVKHSKVKTVIKISCKHHIVKCKNKTFCDIIPYHNIIIILQLEWTSYRWQHTLCIPSELLSCILADLIDFSEHH